MTFPRKLDSSKLENGCALAVVGLSGEMRDQVTNVILNVIASAAGGAVGGVSGAGGASVADMYNRQLHPEEKSLAQEVAAAARRKGITNPDGSDVTVGQIEAVLRAANNSTYGESSFTGMVIPLDGTTPVGAVYDNSGMMLQGDSAGRYWLVQSSSALLNPTDSIRQLVVESSGKDNSPYSWNAPAPGSVVPISLGGYNSLGPFSPGWNTGDYSAGLSRTDFRNNQNFIVQAGFHAPVSPGIGAGYTLSYGSGSYSLKPDCIVGGIFDVGVNAGFYGDSKYSGPAVINIGPGAFAIQLTPSNPAAWADKSWYYFSRYINGVAFGVGVGVGAGVVAPVNVTIDPTYRSGDNK